MNSILKSCFHAILLSTIFGAITARADSAGDKSSPESLSQRLARLEKEWEQAKPNGVRGSGIKIMGFLDTSYVINLADRDRVSPMAGGSPGNTGRVYDNQYNSFNLNALYLGFEKEKDKNARWPVGFRVVTLYGDDATTGAGNDSAFALHHAYIDLGIPIGNGIGVKIGKYLPLVSMEPSPSIMNWQFSRSDALRLTPAAPTGIFFDYTWNPTITTTVALVNGFDQIGMNGGTTLTAPNLNTSYTFTGRVDVNAPTNSVGDIKGFIAGWYGNDDATANTSNDGNISIINFGGVWGKPFGLQPMTLQAEYLYRSDDISTVIVANPVTIEASTVSVYGKWDWLPFFNTSGRFTYSGYHNASGTPAGVNIGLGLLTLPAAGFNPTYTDMFSYTLTQTLYLFKDTIIRLEWRRDWTDTPQAGFGAYGTVVDTQDTLAFNLVHSF